MVVSNSCPEFGGLFCFDFFQVTLEIWVLWVAALGLSGGDKISTDAVLSKVLLPLSREGVGTKVTLCLI